MRRKLVIVQNIPTQFDVPLYARLHDEAPFDFSVYYTVQGEQEERAVDLEAGCAPDWNHLEKSEYPNRFMPTGDAGSVKRLADRIAEEDPNLVVVCGYYPKPHARLAWLLQKRGIAVGLRSDNTLAHSSFKGLKGMLKKILLPRWLRRYDTWHPVGYLAKQYLVQVAGAERPSFLFPYNVDNDWFREKSDEYHSDAAEIRRALGFAPDTFVVLGILKWHEREDPLTLVRAFLELVSKRDNAGLVLVGDGPLRDRVRTEARRLGSKVVLPGYQPYCELPKYYAISNVFVHPAVDECWGVSVNEAMACGLPVVASGGVGAAFDLIEEGRTGAVFPAGEFLALASELLRMVDAPCRAVEMGGKAREKVSTWSYGRTLSEFARAIETAVRLRDNGRG